ncbi:MAG: MazG nucleotide pyrophosphohydrolase domain-containing protein [Patescibacteria group bacterium]|mgnify:CR=1 FL=1
MIKQYQQELDRMFKKRGWEYWPPLSIIARLFEEGGELSRLVNHLYGPKRKKSSEERQELEVEIGDVLYTLICLANSQGVDLDTAIRASFRNAFRRDEHRWSRKKSRRTRKK